MSSKHNLPLILLALVGVVIILISTSRYGAGLSPDSVRYIATARNIIAGDGFTSYDGSPIVIWPPLYPALLALLGGISGIDPLLLTNVVNAIIFGLIVYVGGVLTLKNVTSYTALAYVGMVAILISSALFEVSVMAWTEPLFILLLLLSLYFLDSYLSKKDITSLILFSSSVALSSLTRYIGVTLILWGGLIILIFNRVKIKNRVLHLAAFILISSLPLGLWIVRNYAISGTFFGDRASSAFTLFKNIKFTFEYVLDWYIPSGIAKHRPILIFFGVVVGLLVCLGAIDCWQAFKTRLRQTSPMIIFATIYIVFLVISSTVTANDQIGDRLLSPIYVPFTLFLLVFGQTCIEPYRKRFPRKIVDFILFIGIAIWLVYPVRSTILDAKHQIRNGQGYNSKDWVESETVQYLNQHRTLEAECVFYTNDPVAAYIMTDLAAIRSPAKLRYNSKDIVTDLPSLKGSWPEEKSACLVWFNQITRVYLYTVRELKTIANFTLIGRFRDGVIYSITRK